MWTTQGRCPHTHTSSSSDSQRYFDYFRLDGSGSRHNPQESWADAHVTVATPSMRGFRQNAESLKMPSDAGLALILASFPHRACGIIFVALQRV
jgi:hypothetical protein